MKKISIVVPVYNVEKYLYNCISSLVRQTYRNIEIILVDDGSTDGCAQIIDDWTKKDNRIKVIHKKNGGLSDARNAGINIATGDFICFVDSDDYVRDEMCEYMLDLTLKFDADIVIMNRVYKFENGMEKIRFPADGVISEFSAEEALVELNIFNKYDMSAWCKLYKRELFSDIRFPVGKLSEDYFIMYQLFDKCKKIVYDSRPVYYYMQRIGSISKNKDINHDYADAAYEQMHFLDEKYSQHSSVWHTAYVLANLTVYDMYLKNKIKCPKQYKRKIKKIIRENIFHVKNNKFINYNRKIQIYMFNYVLWLYDIIFSVYRRFNNY